MTAGLKARSQTPSRSLGGAIFLTKLLKQNENKSSASRGFSPVFLSVVLPFSSSRFWLLASCFQNGSTTLRNKGKASASRVENKKTRSLYI